MKRLTTYILLAFLIMLFADFAIAQRWQIVGIPIVFKAETSTMSGDETFDPSDALFFIKDPGGASRNLNPSGTFLAGTAAYVVNTADAAENITFDSDGIAEVVHQNECGIFVYSGAAWKVVYAGAAEIKEDDDLNVANILLKGADRYLNFNSTTGSDGYGVRDESGTMQFKDSTGSWTNFSVAAGDDISLTKSDASGSAQTVNLPTAVGKSEDLYIVVKTDNSANTVTIDPDGAETIDGASKVILRRQYESWAGTSDNANWYTISYTGSAINVKYFGATGDGTTDDTTAIQAAIAASNTGNVLYFPRGNYYVSGELDITNNLQIIGDGFCSQIYQSATNLNLFHFTGAGYFRVENIRLGGEQTTAGKCLIRADANASHGIIRNVSMIGGYYGIGFFGVLFAKIDHVLNTTSFFHEVSADNQAWIYGERSGGRSINGLEIDHVLFQAQGECGIYLTDTNNEGTCVITSGLCEYMTKGIYVSGFYQGLHIDNMHAEGNEVELVGCSHVLINNLFSDGLTLTSCRQTRVINSYLWGGITSSANCQGLKIDSCNHSQANSIAGRMVEVSNISDVGDLTMRQGGTFLVDKSYRNLCDGDLEVWVSGVPLGFTYSPSASALAEEVSIVRFGSKACKVVVPAGQSTAMLLFTLDPTYWDKDETFLGGSITLKCWVYKPAASGFTPQIIFNTTPATPSPVSFTINTEEWTPITKTFMVSTDNAVVSIGVGTKSASPGDYIIVDGIQVVDGEVSAAPYYDDSRGIRGNFRVGGNSLRGGEVSTMAGNETIAYGDGNCFVKDPGGSSRTFNPSGAFPEGAEITVINAADGAENITFDSGTLGAVMGRYECGVFQYDGSAWQILYLGQNDLTKDAAVTFGSATLTDTITLPNTGLHLLDTNGSHDLILAPGSDLTADKTLTLTTGDSDRTITLSGNPTLNDWFDQSVKQAASPTFGSAVITGDISAAGGFKQPFSFMKIDVADEQTAVAMDALGLAGNTEYVMPYAGSVIAISIASNDARTAGTLTVDVTVDGAATGLQAVLDDDPTTYAYTVQAKDTDTFTAGQRLGVDITTDAAWEPDATPDIVVVVIVEM